MEKIIVTQAGGGGKSLEFADVEELVSALCRGSIPFLPLIKNVNFQGQSFEQSEEEIAASDERAESALWSTLAKLQGGLQMSNEEALSFYDDQMGKSESDTIEGVFENCNFDNCVFASKNLNIKAYNCSFKKAYVEFADVAVKGENNDFEGFRINEGDFTMDLKNTSFKDSELYKSHVSGKMDGGQFFNLEGRIWLGQHNKLELKNVDFGQKMFDEDYFFSENLSVINPKMNPVMRAKINEQFPGRIQNNINPTLLKNGRTGK